MCSAVSSFSLPFASIRATVWSSTKRPVQANRETWLRDSWLRMTSTSRADHVLGARGQVGDGDVLLEAVTLAVHIALGEAGGIEDRLAQGLGGDGPGAVEPAQAMFGAVEDGDPAAKLAQRWRP